MKIFLKKLLVVSLISVFLAVFTLPAFAETLSIKEEGLEITLPQGYVEINGENSDENLEIIENFGYTAQSFENYLTKENILLFATNPTDKSQINIKCWESEFSKKAEDLSLVSKESLIDIATRLCGTNTGYNIATVNSMSMIEFSKSDYDSGGDYSTVQYITVRNGKFYSLTVSNPGKLTDQKKSDAWTLVCSLKIDDNTKSGAWSFSGIVCMIFLWALIIAAGIAVVVIIYTFINDIIKSRRGDNSDKDYIQRRK